jgi:SAM-dependent methyltransferase
MKPQLTRHTAPAESRKKYNEKMLRWRCNLVQPYLRASDSVLDVGAGTGWVAKRLAEQVGCSMTLVDVLNCNETDLPLQIYDGKKLPFPDKSFDTVLLVFVLHHTTNHEEILEEARRVARRAIVIVEDTPVNLFERGVELFWDTVLSWEHRFSAPHNYRTIQGWRGVFKSVGLRLAGEDVVRPFFPFYYTKAVFALESK